MLPFALAAGGRAGLSVAHSVRKKYRGSKPRQTHSGGKIMTNIDDHLQEAIRAAKAVFDSLQELAQPVARTADAMVECLCGGKKLLVCGNGGSAADGADF